MMATPEPHGEAPLRQVGDILVPLFGTRLEEIANTIQEFAALKFDARAPIGPDGDIVDAVAAGVNFLGEELEASFREMQRQTHLLNEVTDAVISFDESWIITEWNRGAEAIYGWSTAEALGKRCGELLATQFATTTWEKRSRDLVAEGHWRGEMMQRHKDGTAVYIEASTSRFTGEDGIRIISVNRDISDRRHLDELTRMLELERETAQELRRLDEMKNTFLTAVSHELRTPLTAVLGSALTMERLGPQLSSEDNQVLLHDLSGNARKLDKLLRNLLDLDRLTSGAIEPVRELTDLAALAEHLVSELDIAVEHPLTLDLETVILDVDPGKVERIVENLLFNAVRHTASGTPVWLRVHPWDQGVMISVEDAGEGVPPEIRTTIFEPFSQGKLADPHSPGVGIGLSLVWKLTELHGGRAWVEERPGGGASFRVFLPAPGSADAPTSDAWVAVRPVSEALDGTQPPETESGAPTRYSSAPGAGGHDVGVDT